MHPRDRPDHYAGAGTNDLAQGAEQLSALTFGQVTATACP
jgi:hypothetical protein